MATIVGGAQVSYEIGQIYSIACRNSNKNGQKLAKQFLGTNFNIENGEQRFDEC